MAEPFNSPEEELNFILGNDGEQLFDIDEALEDAAELNAELPSASAAALKYDGDDLDCSLPFTTSEAGPTATMARSEGMAAAMMTDEAGTINEFGHPFVAIPGFSRTVTQSPTIPDGVQDFSDPPVFEGDLLGTFNPVEDMDEFKMDDFNLDLSEDIFPSSGLSLPTTTNAFGLSRRLSGLAQHHFHPIHQPQLQQHYPSLLAPPPLPPPNMKPPPYSHCPPIVHTSGRKRPLRKRKFQIPPSPVPVSPGGESTAHISSSRHAQGPSFATAFEKANEARQARKIRRLRRAKSQAINLVGGGDIKEIERVAVLDSEYSLCGIAPMEETLLIEFSRNFDPKFFVDSAWEQVFETLVESNHTNEVKAAAGLDSLLEPESPSNPHTASPVSDSSEAHAVIQAKDANDNLKALPTGKDAESRRLRRLMRNRLSAQASRDRRKKAIEDVKKQKAEKEEEIAMLEKTVAEENQRMLLLEKAISYAREYLDPDQFARVTAQPSIVHSN